MSFKSFADDSAVASLGGLTIENGTDRLKVYGEVEISRDKSGLEIALKLKEIADAAVAALRADPDLPEKVAPPEKTVTVANPFAKHA